MGFPSSWRLCPSWRCWCCSACCAGRRWQAALAGLVVGLIVAVAVWQMPLGLALNSVANGAVFALWPVMWIVVNALLLYNIAVRSGRFDAFRNWVVNHLPNDRRIVLVVVGFCFGALLEGIAGFGTPVAITSSLLILVGYPPLEALVFMLIFNTAPVAFGALGVPVTVLGAVTGLPATALGAMIGRQLPLIALHAAVLCHGALWRVAFGARSLAGAAGRGRQLCDHRSSSRRTSFDYALTDVLSSLGSLIVTLLFLQVWSPAPDPEFAIALSPPAAAANPRMLAAAIRYSGAELAGLAALDHRLGDRDHLDRRFKLFAIGQQNIPGRACTGRSRSRSTTTSHMPRSGSSSRSAPERRSCSRRSSPRSWSGCRPPPSSAALGETFARLASRLSR